MNIDRDFMRFEPRTAECRCGQFDWAMGTRHCDQILRNFTSLSKSKKPLAIFEC